MASQKTATHFPAQTHTTFAMLTHHLIIEKA